MPHTRQLRLVLPLSKIGSRKGSLLFAGHIKVRLLSVTHGCRNVRATHVEPDVKFPWHSDVGKIVAGLTQGREVVVNVIVLVVEVPLDVVLEVETVIV
mmetsp:Transcript_88767/g.248409  ORF Transcript_88767/g.248409 Transcript_88767/m.248409 type:complete len:98 (+) Transcript_88767:577-870(+)